MDIVIDLQILADTAGYRTLEENLRAMGFERSMNARGQRLSWRWQTCTESGALMVVELLADAPEIAGGRVEPLPTDGNISALNVPPLRVDAALLPFHRDKAKNPRLSSRLSTAGGPTREFCSQAPPPLTGSRPTFSPWMVPAVRQLNSTRCRGCP